MAFDDSQPNWKDLLKVIDEGEHQIVPFIGAGLSMYGSPEDRLPSWGGLVNSVFLYALESGYISDELKVKEIKELISSGNLIQALDYLNQELQPPLFIDLIEKLLSVSNKEVPPAILELVCISWSLIVTTNLDRFIENAWSIRHQKPMVVLTNKDTDKLSKVFLGQNLDKDNVLAKIHGTVERYDSWILTTNQYTWLLNNNEGYVHLLRTLFLRTVFFIGYGLEDDDFDLVFKHLRQIFPTGGGRSFALVPNKVRGTELINKAKEYGLKLIFYTVSGSSKNEKDGGHGQVLECLGLLVQRWKENVGSFSDFFRLLYFPTLDTDFVGRSLESDLISKALFQNQEHGVQVVGFGGEGKTSFVQNFLYQNKNNIAKKGYQGVFGFCFYKHDIGRFINDLYDFLFDRIKAKEESLEWKIQKIKDKLADSRLILVLDGFEVVQSKSGSVLNRMIEEIMDSLLNTSNFIIITSRIEVSNYPLVKIDLGPLSNEDTLRLLELWDISTPDSRLIKWISLEGGRHALSLRILAAFISKQGTSALQDLDRLSLSTIPDELDPLNANKASRLLEYYRDFLSEDQVVFLQCFSLFRRPISLGLILECFPEAHDSDDISFALRGKELRTLIKDLLERRLLISESGTHLTTHPNVKDYFYNLEQVSNSKPFHKRVVNFLLKYLPVKQPETFSEIQYFSELCYHAAKSEQWEVFHTAFFKDINREFRNYLGNNLGAWEEFLDLASLTCKDESWENNPVIYPEYYRATIARCNKHLGQSDFAVREYIKTLKICGNSMDPETAKYTNNFLTLAMLMGRFDLVDCLIPMNFGTLGWIQEEWKYHWQLEHALFPIGHYAALRGDFKTAEEYIGGAYKAWDGYNGKREWVFDFDRVYHSDIILARDLKRLVEAEKIAYDNLNLGKQMKWQETIARSNRCLASILRVSSRNDDSYKLQMAKEHLDTCVLLSERLFIPAMQIEIWLEIIRYELEIILSLNEPINLRNIQKRIEKTEDRINKSKMFQYLPDLKAAWALYYFLDGKKGYSKEIALEGISVAKKQGNLFSLVDPASNYFHLLKIESFNFESVILPNKPVFASHEDLIEKQLDKNGFQEMIDNIESISRSY